MKIIFPIQLYLFLIVFFSSNKVSCNGIYISNQISKSIEDGSISNPFSQISQAFVSNQNQTTLSIFLDSNPLNNTYFLNSTLNLNFDLNLSSYGGYSVILNFLVLGSFFSDGNYSVSFNMLIFQQSASAEAGSVLFLFIQSFSVQFQNCLMKNINNTSNIFSISSAQNLSFYNTNFTSLFISGNNFIEIDQTNLILIENCFIFNILIEDGSFLSSSSFTTIKNSYFLNNTLKQSNKVIIPSILHLKASLQISQSIFFNNSMINSSILLIENDLLNANTQISVAISDAVIFDSNTEVFESALGINIQGPNITLLISDNVIFQNNLASQSLISLTQTLSTFEVDNMSLINNFGFQLINLQLILSISFSNFNCISNNNPQNQNQTTNDLPGNCLSIVDYKDVSLTNCTFSNNFAISTLTGILLSHTSDISLLGLDLNSNLTALLNTIECSNNIVNATQSILTNSGNCILLMNSGLTTIINSNFSKNVINVDLDASFSGNPCLISNSYDNNLIILNSLFSGNQAYSGCSCLNFHGNEIIIINSSFVENRGIKLQIGNSDPSFSIANEGGCMNLGASNVTMENVLIFNSSAIKGAGIFFHNRDSKPYQSLYADNLTIQKNEGTQTAGMELDASLNLGDYYFVNCVFNENTVQFYGVISTFYYTNFNLYFYFNDISYNWGICAGAAFSFCHFGGAVFFNNTNFQGNVLNQSVFVGGAAFFVYGFTESTLIYVKDCNFLENYSDLKGGAIQSTYGQVFVQDSIFIDNFAPIGGAISMSVYCPGSLENVIIQNKYQVNQGGGVHFSDFALMNIINTTFIDCQAQQGGAIYVDGSELVFYYYNISFVNVQAQDGAAIWITNTLAPQTIFQNIFIEQSKSTRSSLIYFDSTNVLLTNLTIINCEGRSLFITNSTLAIVDSEIINHQCSLLNQLGCFAVAEKYSMIMAVNTSFSNVTSLFLEDVFSVTETIISINNITFTNYVSNSESLIITASDSFVIVQDSLLQNLNYEMMNLINSELIIMNCSFLNITSKSSYGIIYFESGQNFLLQNSIFDSIQGNLGGCISLLDGSSQYVYNIINVSATNCISVQGAVGYISDQSISISNSSFQNNSVSDSGGCFYFDCIQESNYQWLINSSSFINNKARQGGAYHSVRYIPIFDQATKFLRNSALYGEIYSAFPVKLTLEINGSIIDCNNNPELCYIRSDDITSGQIMPSLVIIVLDYYGQKMTLLDGLGFLNVYPDAANLSEATLGFDSFWENADPLRPDAIFIGVETQILIAGSFNFSEATVQSQPPSNIWLKVKTDLIPQYFAEFISNSTFFDREDSTQSYFFIFKIHIRDCIPGEIYANNMTECYACPQGKYSFTTMDIFCNDCPIEANCNGGTLFIVKPGYWRPSLSSDDLYSCNIMTDSCLGGLNSSCLNGYTGVLCGACEYDQNKKFFQKGLYYCEECANVWIYILLVVFFVIAIIGLITFLIYSKKGSDIENYVLIKILMSHITTVSFLSNIKINFPKTIHVFSGVQAPATSIDSVVFTIGCFQDKIGMSNFETKLILSTLLPVVTILFVILIYLIYGVYARKNRKQIGESIINALIIILSFFQPSFINFYIQNLSCDKIGNTSYMTYDMEQECWNETHTLFSILIIMPFLILWMIIFPMVFLIYMISHRKKLRDPHVFHLTRFFQAGYIENRFYWEFVQMSRKFSVILLTTFLRNSPQSVVYVLIPVLSLYCVLQIMMMPYQHSKYHDFNFLEMTSLIACFITYYCAVFYTRVFTERNQNFLLFTIIFFNFGFFSFWVRNYLIYMKGRISKIFSSYQLSGNKSTDKRNLKSLNSNDSYEMKSRISMKS